MNALRDAATRIAATRRYPTPGGERKLACERAAARLADRAEGERREPEPWDAFLRRIGLVDG